MTTAGLEPTRRLALHPHARSTPPPCASWSKPPSPCTVWNATLSPTVWVVRPGSVQLFRAGPALGGKGIGGQEPGDGGRGQKDGRSRLMAPPMVRSLTGRVQLCAHGSLVPINVSSWQQTFLLQCRMHARTHAKPTDPPTHRSTQNPQCSHSDEGRVGGAPLGGSRWVTVRRHRAQCSRQASCRHTVVPPWVTTCTGPPQCEKGCVQYSQPPPPSTTATAPPPLSPHCGALRKAEGGGLWTEGVAFRSCLKRPPPSRRGQARK